MLAAPQGDTMVDGGVAKRQCTSLQRWVSWFDSNIRLQTPARAAGLRRKLSMMFKPIPFLLYQLLLAWAAPFAARASAPPAPAPLVPSTYNYYVASTGSDANPGTEALPFATILRASRVALPGTTIHVAPGNYDGGFKTTMNGTSAQRIFYISTTRWGARIVPPAHSTTNIAWDNRGNFIDIVGFDIDGSNTNAGTKWTYGIYNAGSFDVIRNNHVHHLMRDLPCASSGGAGIHVDSYYKGDKVDVVGNSVHDIGPQGCRFVQGISLSTSGSAKNNVVYGIGGAAIQMWHDATNVAISNNTVSGSSTGILVGGGDNYYSKGPNDYTTVHNNIVYDNRYGISEQGATGVHNSYRNNLVFHSTSSDWSLRNGLTHEGTVAQAPQFLKYARVGTPDFRLKSNSPAIGRGTEEQAAATDMAGKTRSKITGIDIGAFQR